MNFLQRPEPSEYPAYYETYFKTLPEATDIFAELQQQVETLVKLFDNVEEFEAEKPYAEGKWSLKELLQHMLDTERIMAYRALSFSRGEAALLPGFEEDEYVKRSFANRRDLDDLLAEYQLQRQSTIALAKSFTPEMLLMKGNANGNESSVRALIWVIAAHENHHLNIVRERYLPVFTKAL